jgi:hypothetical protein
MIKKIDRYGGILASVPLDPVVLIPTLIPVVAVLVATPLVPVLLAPLKPVSVVVDPVW